MDNPQSDNEIPELSENRNTPEEVRDDEQDSRSHEPDPNMSSDDELSENTRTARLRELYHGQDENVPLEEDLHISDSSQTSTVFMYESDSDDNIILLHSSQSSTLSQNDNHQQDNDYHYQRHNGLFINFNLNISTNGACHMQ